MLSKEKQAGIAANIRKTKDVPELHQDNGQLVLVMRKVARVNVNIPGRALVGAVGVEKAIVLSARSAFLGDAANAIGLADASELLDFWNDCVGFEEGEALYMLDRGTFPNG